MSARPLQLLAALLAIPALVWATRLLAGTPPLILAGAAGPAAIYAGLLCRAQRGEHRPAGLLAAAFLWGAIGAAFLAQVTNDLARHYVATLAGAGQARGLTATLVAPAIEEGAKAAGLLLLVLIQPKAIAGPRDGIVYGALVGVGFVLTENLLYLAFAVLQGGAAGLARGVYLRALLAGGNHAVFTATVGAGIGCARAAATRRRRVRAVLVAIAAALLQHLAWNAVAAEAMTRALCGAAIPGASCRPTPAAGDLFLVVPLLVAVFLAPGGGVLLLLAARDARRATA